MNAATISDLEAALYATISKEGAALNSSTAAIEPVLRDGEGVHNREEGMRRDARALVQTLSAREHTVLEGLTRGYDLKTIAANLGLNSRTVEVYRMKACEKLGAKSDVELVWFGIYADIVSINRPSN